MQYTETQVINPEKTSQIISTIIKFLLGVEIFAMPLLFLPLTSEFYETAKLLFLSVANLIIIALILVQYGVKNEFRVFKTHIEFFLLFVLLASLVSTFLAVDRNTGLWGYYGRGSDTFIYFLSLISFIYIVVNTIQTEVHLERYVSVFLGSSCIVGLLFVVQQFMGSNALFSHYPLLGYAGFSPILSTDVLAFYALLPIFLALGLLYVVMTSGVITISSLFQSVLSVLTFVVMIVCVALAATNLLPLVLLFLGALYFLYLLARVEKHVSNRFFATTGIVIAGVTIAALMHTFIPGKTNPLPVLDFSNTWAIYTSLLHDMRLLLFGTGPDTFYFVFLKFIPAAYYTTSLYATDFSKAPVQIMQSLITQGLVGTIAYLSLIVASLISSWRAFKQTEDGTSKIFIASFSTGVLVYFFSLFVANTSLAFDFAFFLIAGFIAYERTITNASTKGFLNIRVVIENYWDKTSMIVKNSIYALLILFLLLLSYLDIANYQAATAYYASLQSTNAQTRYTLALAAAEHNPQIDYYQNNLANAGLQVALAIATNYSSIKDDTQKKNAADLEQKILQQSISKSAYTLAQNQLNPIDLVSSINLLAVVSKNSGNDTTYLSQAIQEAEFLNQLFPSNINYLNITGQLYLQNKQYDKALALYKQIYGVNKTDINFNYNYALALEGNKQYPSAVGILEAILPKLDPKSNAYATIQAEIKTDKAAK